MKKIFTFRFARIFSNLTTSKRGAVASLPPSPTTLLPTPITRLKRADLSVIQYVLDGALAV